MLGTLDAIAATVRLAPAELAYDGLTLTLPEDYAGSDLVGVNDPSLGHWPNTSPMLPSYRTQATTHDFYVEDAWTLSDRWLLLADIRRLEAKYRNASPDELFKLTVEQPVSGLLPQ